MESTAIVLKQDLRELDYEGLISFAVTAREAHDNSRWDIGDAASVVVVKFGYGELDDFASKVGIGKENILRYKDVAELFNPEIREEFRFLSWSHFRALASIEDQKQRLEWLKMAADNEWSVEQTQIERKKEKIGSSDIIVRPKLLRCDVCSKYYIADHKDDSWCKSKGKHYD